MELIANISHRTMVLYNGTVRPLLNRTHRCDRNAADGSAVYVPLIHGVVMLLGLFMNSYMLLILHSRKGRRKRPANIDVYFSQLGICDICTLLTLPVWLTQSVLHGRWIFGYAMCKVFKGLTTVCANIVATVCVTWHRDLDMYNTHGVFLLPTALFPVRGVPAGLRERQQIYEDCTQ